MEGVIFRTTNNGNVWTEQSNGLTVLDVSALSINSLNHIFAGTIDGIFMSTDNGGNWSLNNNGITASDIRAFTIDQAGFVYAGSTGSGVFKSITSTIPVELVSLSVIQFNNSAELNWHTSSEINNRGFEVERSSDGNIFYTIGFVNGSGTTTESRSYKYIDDNVLPGINYYRLKQFDYNGTFEYSPVVEINISPVTFYLDQNYPNPFNPVTKIKFGLTTVSNVTIKIFNVLGQEVLTLLRGEISAGLHSVDFNASAVNSGVYFYTLEAIGTDGEKFISTKKMIVIK
jgi:hypothetical protein